MLKFSAPLPPDWRWEKVQQAVQEKTPPEEVFLREVYDVITGAKPDDIIREALYLFHVPYERDTLVSFFLSGATLNQILYGTGVRIEVLRVFESLFMDRTQLKNKMEWRLYGKYYAANKATDDVRRQIEVGLAYGPSVLMDYWTMGNDVMEIPEKEILSRWTMTAYSKAMVARGSSVNSAAAKEAFKWGAIAVKSVMELRNAKTDNDTSMDAVLAIEQRKNVVNPKELGVPLTDIMH
jgi:hypothetical protein